jgi:predicted metal-dependent phosphoesterase TrpH/glycosyltransferase involved in cell wall biosynthesis
MRVCLVTPFAWSQPHEVNEHVAGVAEALRQRGHAVTVLAPSSRARDLRAGRRALAQGVLDGLVVVGPALPVSRRSLVAVPVGIRANLRLALQQGRFDVVHGFEPGLPSLSYLALRDAPGLTAATFFSPERLLYPPSRARRERLLARLDALLAVSPQAAEAARLRFPGDFTIISPGVDPALFRPGEKERLIVVELPPGDRAGARALLRVLDELPGWTLCFLQEGPLAARPYVPLRLRPRVQVRVRPEAAARAALLARAAIFVPAWGGRPSLALEAAAAGAAAVEAPAGAPPQQLALSAARLAGDERLREELGRQARRRAEGESFATVARRLEGLYQGLGRRRRVARVAGDPLADREWIVCDLHTHSSWSHDCAVPVRQLIEQAEARGLGAIAVTDHNRLGGALEALELARGRRLAVIPGEEVKTAGQGEVIGLFLREEIPAGLSFADTIAAIRAQGGLVYLPHPFDRRHAVPDAATLQRHLADIDVIEVYNARLLLEGYNEEALRFARKYNLLMGAGSDAHVLPGLGTGAVRMRAFRTPEEFLLSLRSAEILRRPRSLAYLQSLKWVAQVREKVRS